MKNYKFLTIFLFLVLSIQLNAQQIEITGVVTNQKGEEIPGVTVVSSLNSDYVTVTDLNGTYKITTNANDVLAFLFIGFEKEKVKVNSQTIINVVLVENAQELAGIVVVGYGVQKKKDLTGSISSVNSDYLNNTQSMSLSSILQGRVSGLDVVSNSGAPGRDVEINIRGVSSINGAPPLWVVDGVPVSGDVNVKDIESVEILKDASATSIYGTRGAGGVILVTTKKGKNGKMSMNYSNRFSFGQMYKRPNMLNAAEWVKIRTEAYQNASLPVPQSLQDFAGGEGTDWLNEITRTSFSYDNYLNFSGKSDKLNYFMSFSNGNDQGIVLKSNQNTSAFRINTSSQIFKWLKVGENLSVSKTTTHLVNEDDEWNAVLIQSIAIDPVTPVYDEDGSWAGTSYNSIQNPVAHLDRTKGVSEDFSIGGNVYAEIAFSKNLILISRFGYEQDNSNYYGFSPTYYVKPGEENGLTSVSRDYSQNIDWISSTFLTWNKEFSKQSLKIMIGYEIEKNDFEYFGTSATALISEAPNMIFIDNATGNQTASSYGSEISYGYISYFSRLNYNLLDKYLLTLNIRRQGSSKFGIDNRFGIFPSASAAWKISNEEFIENIPAISLMKLRVGYGITGNDQPLAPYSFYSSSTPGQRYVFNNTITDGVVFPMISNPELHWEQKKSLNIGYDMNLLKNRITFSGDFFIENTNAMLYNPDLPGHIGTQDMPYTNVASMKNTGFEFELGFKQTNNDFKYGLNFTFSHVKNEVLNLGNAKSISAATFMQFGYISRTEVGHPMAMFYGYVTDGLFQNQSEVDAYIKPNGDPIQPNAAPGDIRYEADENGDLIVDFIGNPFPKFTAGMNYTMSYKNFDFLIVLYGVYGNQIFNASRFFTLNSSVRYNMDASIKDRWMMEGDTDDPNLARVNLYDANNALRSDRFIEDGSYLRIKNVQLGYTFDNVWIKSLGFSELKMFVGAQNLYTLTNYSGFDPEVGIGWGGPLDRGVDRVKYPSPRTIYFGLNLSF